MGEKWAEARFTRQTKTATIQPTSKGASSAQGYATGVALATGCRVIWGRGHCSMSMRSLLAAVGVSCVAASASAELKITEICARCQPTVPAQKDLGWIELYNNGTEAVNLANYKLVRTNRGKAPAPAKISALLDRTVEPGAYTVVYTSEMFDNGAAATTVVSYTYGNYGEIMVAAED